MDYTIVYRRLVWPIVSLVLRVLGIGGVIAAAFIVYAILKFRINLLHMPRWKLVSLRIQFKPLDFLRWMLVDTLDAPDHRDEFREYGLTMYCGRQGAGKTISMVEYLNRMRERYPECIIVTNFDYRYADRAMESWRDFMEIRNGEEGVIFAIDEIHSEYSAASWKDFPEDLLSEISQQRKQRIKIVATAQIFTRMVKQLREQAFTVIQCSTMGGRWTTCKEYDAKDYEAYCDGLIEKKLRPLWRRSFVQSDDLRQCYDTYAKIERLQKIDFIERSQRGGGS